MLIADDFLLFRITSDERLSRKHTFAGDARPPILFDMVSHREADIGRRGHEHDDAPRRIMITRFSLPLCFIASASI